MTHVPSGLMGCVLAALGWWVGERRKIKTFRIYFPTMYLALIQLGSFISILVLKCNVTLIFLGRMQIARPDKCIPSRSRANSAVSYWEVQGYFELVMFYTWDVWLLWTFISLKGANFQHCNCNLTFLTKLPCCGRYSKFSRDQGDGRKMQLADIWCGLC